MLIDAQGDNTVKDLFNKVCFPNKNLNLCVFNMMKEIDESKTLTNHI